MPREQAARALDRYEPGPGERAGLRVAERRAAGAVPDPAARAERRDAAAARRADRQPRPALGRGAGGGARGVRGDRAGGHARPLVRPRLRPLPGVRRRRARGRAPAAGVGRGQGGARAMSLPARSGRHRLAR
nr:hypothetical protein [Angustibacter aerolatus]